MAAGEDLPHLRQRSLVLQRRDWLKHEHMGIALVVYVAHAFEGHEYILVVGAVVGRILDFELEQADHVPGRAIDGHVFADRIACAEHFFRGIRSKDENVAVFGEVALLEVTAFGHVQLAYLAIGILNRLALYGDDPIAIFVSDGIVPFRADQAN